MSGGVGVVTEGSNVPKYKQLAAILRAMILAGDIEPARPVPSKKQLTGGYAVSGGTVDKAIDLLRAENLVESVQGLGIFVTARDQWRLSGD
jgi:DNA-binding GntR family transcriptional regulator